MFGKALMSGLLMAAVTAQAVTIETVPVGNTGNTGELSGQGAGNYGPDRICGAVNYAYNIGKYEVTAGQYTAFLNAVGGVDTYALYNTEMSNTSYGSGITRSGSGTVEDRYTYTVDSAFVSRPVNYVSYWDACRFANWLHNDQKTTAQDPNVTEHGAYTLTADGISNNTILRNTDWKWAVTSEDEWYKAAYHKNDGNTGNYFVFPTSSSTYWPGNDMQDPFGNNANVYGSPYPIDSGKYTTLVGQFKNSASPYDTFDQCGNVWEWNESIVYGSDRGLRGGGFDAYGGALPGAHRDYYSPTAEEDRIGFRVVSVPEPSTFALLGVGAIGLLGYGWRRRKR